MAAKYEFLVQNIKTGSFVYFNFPNEVKDGEENKKCLTSVNRKQKSSGTLNKQYVCGTCDKVFTRKSSLERHHRVHTGDKPYECKVCSKVFTQSVNLQYHQATHTDFTLFIVVFVIKDLY